MTLKIMHFHIATFFTSLREPEHQVTCPVVFHSHHFYGVFSFVTSMILLKAFLSHPASTKRVEGKQFHCHYIFLNPTKPLLSHKERISISWGFSIAPSFIRFHVCNSLVNINYRPAEMERQNCFLSLRANNTFFSFF